MSYKQSLAYWCLADTEWNWSAEQICQAAVALGIQGLELPPPEVFPLLKKYNLESSLGANGMPGAPFVKGLNNVEYHEEIITRTKSAIDLASEYGFPNVIAFTGYKWRDGGGDISRDECMANCVKGLLELGGYAAAKNVTICLEHLNSRVSSHPMKGHPGYQGDDVDFCAAIIREVNLPSVRLLFDFYHVQVMHGDIITRLEANRDVIGHLHTAGCPGRNELDNNQEINYAPIAKAVQDMGYSGYIGHEFIPTRDPLQGFKEAVNLFTPR